MSGFSDKGLDRFDELVGRAVSDGQAPGVVSGLAHGDATHYVAAGAATVGGAVMARDTIVRISSVTKPMVAAVALAQVAEGKIGFDEPVDAWLPELAHRRVLVRPDGDLNETVPASRPVTLRDLLTATWGLGMHGALFGSASPWPIQAASDNLGLGLFGMPLPANMPDADTWLARLGELPLLAQPGEKWLYQTSSTVLGLLLGRVDGRPLGEVMRDRLFDPLGMVDTSFATSHSDRLATLYARNGAELVEFDAPDGQWSVEPRLPDGAGGLLSTAKDLLAFGRMVRRGGEGVVPRELVSEMTRNQLSDTQRRNDWDGFSFLDDRGWGYGVSVLQDRYQWEGGFGTVWCNVPASDLTVVVLSQRVWDETGPPAIIEDAITSGLAALA